MSSTVAKAVRIERFGGPEEMKLVDVSVGEPGPGEIRIRHKAVGLTVNDVHPRTGMYRPCPFYTSYAAAA